MNTKSEDRCPHEKTVLVWTDYETIGRAYYFECSECWYRVKRLSKKEMTEVDLSTAIEHDDSRRMDWWNKIWDDRKENIKIERQEKNKEWWEWYNEYLKTPAWLVKREAVLKRENYICQGCGKARATQVHHLTYERVGVEMLFDLVAICKTCHDSIPNSAV
jgi:5-methylcytosine-specific restriction endonuclease McrA